MSVKITVDPLSGLMVATDAGPDGSVWSLYRYEGGNVHIGSDRVQTRVTNPRFEYAEDRQAFEVLATEFFDTE